MKKIKYLLGIGIFGALFSSCFAGKPYYIDFITQSGGNSSFSVTSVGGSLLNHYNSSNTTEGISPYYGRKSSTFSSDISLYSLQTTLLSYIIDLNFYYNSNGNSLLLFAKSSNGGYYPSVLLPITMSFGNLTSEDLLSSSYGLYARVVGNSNCLASDIMTNENKSFCEPYLVFIHGNGTHTVSSLGNIYDSSYNGVDYNKGAVSNSVGIGYSFGFVTGSGWIQDGSNFSLNTGNGDFFDLRTVYFDGSSPSFLNGVLLTRLDNNNPLSIGSGYQVFALGLTGNVDNYSFIYSIYNCPGNAVSPGDCSFYQGGNVQENFSYSFSESNPYNNLIYMLTNPYTSKFRTFYSSNNNQLTFYRVSNIRTYNVSEETTSITINLVPSDGIDIVGGLPSGDGGNSQSTYSGSVSFNNCIDTRICWDSTGENGEVYTICTNECVSSGVIASGGYIGYNGTFYYVDSNYNVGNISNSDGILFDTGFLDEDGLLSIGYYSGLFNGQGFKFGVCPYPPSNFLNFATKVKLGNYYPFMPLNCFISAFQQGVKVHYFDDSGLFPDNNSQLMVGDSHYHKTLFRFFDVLLSFGLLLLFSALLRIIKK